VSRQLQASAALLQEKDPLIPVQSEVVWVPVSLGVLNDKETSSPSRQSNHDYSVFQFASQSPYQLLTLGCLYAVCSVAPGKCLPKICNECSITISLHFFFQNCPKTGTCVVKISGSRGNIIRIATRLWIGRFWSRIAVGKRDLSVFHKSIPPPGPTQLVPWFFRGSKVAGTTHLHLMPRLRMCGAVPLLRYRQYLPVVDRENFTFVPWCRKDLH
jgi:hypothetical protein